MGREGRGGRRRRQEREEYDLEVGVRFPNLLSFSFLLPSPPPPFPSRSTRLGRGDRASGSVILGTGSAGRALRGGCGPYDALRRRKPVGRAGRGQEEEQEGGGGQEVGVEEAREGGRRAQVHGSR